MAMIVSAAVIFLLLVVNEVWWRIKRFHGELSRKFVHITVGSFVAFWPFFLSWREIEIFSAAFLAAVAISRYQNIFKAIHSVQRPTEGELFFAIAVGAIAITHDKWIYMTALLQMSLADGLAAVAGVQFGRGNRYKVLGQTKSIIGTTVFAVVSAIVLAVYDNHARLAFGLPYIATLTIVATCIENLAVFGLDNLLVPVLIALALRTM